MSIGPVKNVFFHKDPQQLAVDLLGKVLRHRFQHPRLGPVWLSARIIETEAYYLSEKGSHSSLGRTKAREAMFMAPGTIYMYYARGADSLNFSALGEGNAVLIKSGVVHLDEISPENTVEIMQELNPLGSRLRPAQKLCSGQTLLCRSLNLKVPDWNQQQLDPEQFYLEDTGYRPAAWIQCRRLGIPQGRDEHLPYRFIDLDETKASTGGVRSAEGGVRRAEGELRTPHSALRPPPSELQTR